MRLFVETKLRRPGVENAKRELSRNTSEGAVNLALESPPRPKG